MINVLIVATGGPPRRRGLLEILQKFDRFGCDVTIVTGDETPERFVMVRNLAKIHTLPPDTSQSSAPAGPEFSALADGSAAGSGTEGERLWLRFEKQPAGRRAAARADVMIALDPSAIFTVWKLAKEHPKPAAVVGLAPALKHVEEQAGRPMNKAARMLQPIPSPRKVVRTGLRRATGAARKVGKAATGKRAAGTPVGRKVLTATVEYAPMPARARLPLAKRVAVSLINAGYAERMYPMVTTVAARIPQLSQRAAFLAELAKREFASGRTPGFLREAAAARFAVSDQAFAKGDITTAVNQFRQATNLLVNRAAHFDGTESPAMADPERFYRPLRDSAVGKAVAKPRGRSAQAGTERPQRVLFLYYVNKNFLGPIVERYEKDPSLEIRVADIKSPEVMGDSIANQTVLIEDLVRGGSEYREQVTAALNPLLEWADVVFVDWCNMAPVLLTMIDPGTTRVVVRLHSGEAWAEWPHLVDWSRVDDLVFVSEHLRDFALKVIPRLAGPSAPRRHVLTNAMDLGRFHRPKDASARFNLGLVGINAAAKDPRWALEVLRHLRAKDDRYRLLLIGRELTDYKNETLRNYFEPLAAELRELEGTGAVRLLGHTDDVPEFLREIGVIISSSVRESFHVGLVEGAAGAAVPVVRDWPFFAAGGRGARALFPSEWVVDTPAQAAERILATTRDEETWRSTGTAAATHVMTTWDWPVVAPAYDKVITGA